MTKQERYEIVWGLDREDLVNKVRAAMNEGWWPLGTPFTVGDSTHSGYWYQGLIRFHERAIT